MPCGSITKAALTPALALPLCLSLPLSLSRAMPSQTQRAATHRYVSVHKMSANMQHVRRATRCDALAALLEKRESANAANVTA